MSAPIDFPWAEPPDEGEATRLARRYDFVSFEHWERRPRWPALHRIVMRLRG